MNGTKHIRLSCPADRQALEELYARSFGCLLRGDYAPLLVKRALPHLSRVQGPLDKGTYFVVEDSDGHLIGAGGWSEKRPGTGEVEPGTAHLRHFAVDPIAARTGLGRALFDACLSAAGRQLRFECYATRNAQPFYSALGFRAVGQKTIPMEPDLRFPSVHMIKDPETSSVR